MEWEYDDYCLLLEGSQGAVDSLERKWELRVSRVLVALPVFARVCPCISGKESELSEFGNKEDGLN